MAGCGDVNVSVIIDGDEEASDDDVTEDDCRHHGGGSVSLPLLPPTGGEMEEEERARIEPIIPLLRTIRAAAIWRDIIMVELYD